MMSVLSLDAHHCQQLFTFCLLSFGLCLVSSRTKEPRARLSEDVASHASPQPVK